MFHPEKPDSTVKNGGGIEVERINPYISKLYSIFHIFHPFHRYAQFSYK
jgi:hypothetical protein